MKSKVNCMSEGQPHFSFFFSQLCISGLPWPSLLVFVSLPFSLPSYLFPHSLEGELYSKGNCGSLRVSSSWILERGTLFCFVLDLRSIVYLCSSLSARVSLSSLFGCSLSVVIDGLALLRDCSPWTWLMIWFPHGFPHMASAEITQAEKCFSHQLIPRAADQSINQTLWSGWSELDP